MNRLRFKTISLYPEIHIDIQETCQ